MSFNCNFLHVGVCSAYCTSSHRTIYWEIRIAESDVHNEYIILKVDISEMDSVQSILSGARDQ